MSQNLQAFLDMIAVSEGTSTIPGSDNGYRVIVGSTVANPHLFDAYSDHPRVLVDLGHGLKSTAAGRYQILARYFDAYKTKLALPDFSPASQDKIAVQMIRERGALDAIAAGSFEYAVTRCSNIWASLPGNNYEQHQNQLADLQIAFEAAGGVVA